MPVQETFTNVDVENGLVVLRVAGVTYTLPAPIAKQLASHLVLAATMLEEQNLALEKAVTNR